MDFIAVSDEDIVLFDGTSEVWQLELEVSNVLLL